MFPGMKNCCPWALLYNCGKPYGCWITWTWHKRKYVHYFTIQNDDVTNNDIDLTWGIDVEDIGCIACPIDCWKLAAGFPIPVIVMPAIALPVIIWFMADMLIVDIAAIFIAFMGDELATFPPFCCCWPPGDGPGVFGCCCWGLISCCCCWGLDMICCWNTNWKQKKKSSAFLFSYFYIDFLPAIGAYNKIVWIDRGL